LHGDWASAEAAEAFGAAVLNIAKDEYYKRLCELDRNIHANNEKSASPLDINPLNPQNQPS
jgi:hypothetical protein